MKLAICIVLGLVWLGCSDDGVYTPSAPADAGVDALDVPPDETAEAGAATP